MENAINVNEPERWIYVVGGAALAAYGLTRRSMGGLVLAGLGGFFIWRGLASEAIEAGENVSVPYGRGIRVEEAVTIQRTPEELYRFWKNLENLPRFLTHLQSVRVRDEKRSHWTTRGPAGSGVEWDAEIINEIPNELIGWRSVDDSQVPNAGSVHFTRAMRGGTEVRVLLRYDPPGGKAGAAIAKLFGEDPAKQVREDLVTLKMLLETGETEAGRG
ncbi:MAG TPA: SRPBCC family protein [Thermoanaerobaculia bacterium]|nr:SRPBCC family protein [Thermoanaerobaculia bacterium]